MSVISDLEKKCFSRLMASASRGAAGDARDLHILASSKTPGVSKLGHLFSELMAHFETVKPAPVAPVTKAA